MPSCCTNSSNYAHCGATGWRATCVVIVIRYSLWRTILIYSRTCIVQKLDQVNLGTTMTSLDSLSKQSNHRDNGLTGTVSPSRESLQSLHVFIYCGLSVYRISFIYLNVFVRFVDKLIEDLGRFLAERTNGCAYATVLCPSVCRLSSVTYVLWLNAAS